jgi:type II secretory pathway component PulJ
MGQRMGQLIKCQRGETLMEGIVSILIFTVLIAAVTMIINFSFRLTANSFAFAEQRQAQVNWIRGFVPLDNTGLEAPEEDNNPVDLVFSNIIVNGVSQPIIDNIDVVITRAGGFVSFEMP